MTQKLLAELYCPVSTQIQRDAAELAGKAILRNFGGVTVEHCFGRWASSKGHIISENVRKFSVVCDDRGKMMHIAEAFKARALEETVLLTFQPIEAYFI